MGLCDRVSMVVSIGLDWIGRFVSDKNTYSVLADSIKSKGPKGQQ